MITEHLDLGDHGRVVYIVHSLKLVILGILKARS